MTKKKIAVLSSAVSAIVVTTFAIFALAPNPAITGTIPAFLTFAACPAMCMGMGGIFWLVKRFSRNARNKDETPESRKIEN